MEIGRTDGVILLLLFIGFLVWMVRSALKAHAASAEAEDPSGEYKIYPAWKCALYIVGGAVADVYKRQALRRQKRDYMRKKRR